MAKITIDERICKGCGLCADACPKKVISLSEHRMNANGYFVAEAVNPQNCIGCTFCAVMCPDCAIEVERRREEFEYVQDPFTRNRSYL